MSYFSDKKGYENFRGVKVGSKEEAIIKKLEEESKGSKKSKKKNKKGELDGVN